MSLPDGKYEYFSPAAKNIFGFDADEWLNSPLLIKEIIHPDFTNYFSEKWEELLKGIVPEFYEYRIIDPEGEERWISQSNTGIFDDQNNIIAIEGLCRNITEQKKAEEQIKASLKEKETLLQEVHHRVKNNMAVVSSLLGLQAVAMKDEPSKEALRDSQSRVHSMSAIHETLYQSENLSSIDMKVYLSKLVSGVVQNFNISSKVNIVIEAENILIGVKQASPLGLVVNELITNSTKYAFPENQKGEIKISLRKTADQCELAYADNGIGIPGSFDWKNTNSMGLKLVKMLVENQLDGSIDMEPGNGTKFIIKCNIDHI